jgi:hypothetical protein
MTSHFGLMVIFAVFVSTVFAALMRDDPREQLRLWARLFAGFIGAGVVIGWLLYPLPL